MNADRTAMFLVDNRTKELYARVFDMGEAGEDNEPPTAQEQKEIRFESTTRVNSDTRFINTNILQFLCAF